MHETATLSSATPPLAPQPTNNTAREVSTTDLQVEGVSWGMEGSCQLMGMFVPLELLKTENPTHLGYSESYTPGRQ